jgi:hypothetical protein
MIGSWLYHIELRTFPLCFDLVESILNQTWKWTKTYFHRKTPPNQDFALFHFHGSNLQLDTTIFDCKTAILAPTGLSNNGAPTYNRIVDHRLPQQNCQHTGLLDKSILCSHCQMEITIWSGSLSWT